MAENRIGTWMSDRLHSVRERTETLRGASREDEEELEVFTVRSQDREGRAQPMGNALLQRLRLVFADQTTRTLTVTILAALAAALMCFWLYGTTHVYDEYSIRGTVALADIDGTQYEMLGGRLIKYSPDGVFCVTRSNELKWSAAYTMQTPISQVCGDTMVIAEQQGNLVYVINDEGVMGHFETSLPILKARVSSAGVTALLLSDADVTWISLYDSAGNPLATVKATPGESGVPLDMAITPNARQMIVSYLKADKGGLSSTVAFYDFSSPEDADTSHLIGSISYERAVFPEVFFADAGTPVAVSDGGFSVYRVGKSVKETASVSFDREIVSTFHDAHNLGFIFHSDQTEDKYDMEVYGYKGKRSMETSFLFEYSGIRMENGEILLYDASDLYIYRTSGKQKLHTSYEKEVIYFTGIPGYRRYMVVTDASIDQIRIR